MRSLRLPLTLSLSLCLLACATGGRDPERTPGEERAPAPPTEALAAPVAPPLAVSTPSAPSVPRPPLRGLWVARWSLASPEAVRRIIHEAAGAGFNAVFLQVRGRADAFYRSEVEPWAVELGGPLGRDPGWDPLGVALEAAREVGVELHAWVNVMPVWSGIRPPDESLPRHVLLDHPEWRMVAADGRRQRMGDPGYQCVSPGIPEVRAHLLAVFEDLLSRYPVQGLHLDYIRYCGAEFSHDPVSRARFAEARAGRPGLTWEDWQRDQITELIRGARTVVDGYPGVELTAAVWHNHALPVPGSSGYRDYYQDAHRWLREGLVDALVPMVYLRRDSRPSFDVLAADHLAQRGPGRVYLGVHALGRERAADRDYSGAALLENLETAWALGADGVVVFAWSLLEDGALLPTVYEAPGFPGDPATPPARRSGQNPAASPSPRGSAAP